MKNINMTNEEPQDYLEKLKISQQRGIEIRKSIELQERLALINIILIGFLLVLQILNIL